MKWSAAQEIVEQLRAKTSLWLPPLTARRGFSSSRIEHLLNLCVRAMPIAEMYFEVGVLEGRTLSAAAADNWEKTCWGCDTEKKYVTLPGPFAPQVTYLPLSWEQIIQAGLPRPIGVIFYDGGHTAEETCLFLCDIVPFLADEAVIILDDWDRESVRQGAFAAARDVPQYRLLREMPEYGDGLTCPSHHFGYAFGVSVWGYRR